MNFICVWHVNKNSINYTEKNVAANTIAKSGVGRTAAISTCEISAGY